MEHKKMWWQIGHKKQTTKIPRHRGRRGAALSGELSHLEKHCGASVPAVFFLEGWNFIADKKQKTKTKKAP